MTRHAWFAAACIAVFVATAYTSMRNDAATWDETHYLGLGKYLLQNQRWDVPGAILHPPLSYYLNSIPLLFDDTGEVAWSTRALDADAATLADAARGRALLSSPANADDRLLTLARLPMVLLGALLCGFVYAWSRRLYGGAGAVVATTLCCFCPNILAHTRLITPDIALTAFGFIACFFLWRMIETGRTRDGLAGGAAFGLALLSKYVAVLYVPVSVALIVAALLAKRSVDRRGVVAFYALAFLILCLGYGFDLTPYLDGLAFQRAHASTGQASFLFGAYSSTGWWHYFLAAFAIKSTVPFLVLLVAAGVIRRREALESAFLLLPPLTVFAFFSLNHQSIGLRYVLPAFPFLFVFAARAALHAAPWRRWLGGALLAWHAGASLWIHPHYLAYFNELVGGPSRGSAYLVDSNLDWGQELKELAAYLKRNGVERIHLSYFGTDAPERYGIAYDWLPSVGLPNPTPGHVAPLDDHCVAISATNLRGVYFEQTDLYAFFARRTPVATIGYGIFVYCPPF